MNIFQKNPHVIVPLLLGLALSAPVWSAPQISSVSGDITHGSELSISGQDFGGKNPARPYFWAPMEGSSDPSTLGLVTQWSLISRMEYVEGQGIAGGGALVATDSSGTWTAQVNAEGFSWSDPGQKMYLFRKLKHNFSIFEPVAINWKSWRLWGNIQGSGRLTSVMDGVWNGSVALDHSVESGQSLYPIDDKRAAFGIVGQWNTNEILMRSNTNALGRGDGFFQYRTNGKTLGEIPYQAWDGTRHFKLWDAETNPQLQRNFIVHGVKANHTMGPNDRYWATDVYLDTTWARVMIGDAPTLSESTHLEIQIPIAWSASAITVVLNMRTFPADRRPYLFVIDQNNNASQGYALGVPYPKPPEPVVVQ